MGSAPFTTVDEAPHDDLLAWAWTLIANVDWMAQSDDWVDGAERWRDAYHDTLPQPPQEDEW